jgi:hypothetical protein
VLDERQRRGDSGGSLGLSGVGTGSELIRSRVPVAWAKCAEVSALEASTAPKLEDVAGEYRRDWCRRRLSDRHLLAGSTDHLICFGGATASAVDGLDGSMRHKLAMLISKIRQH